VVYSQKGKSEQEVMVAPWDGGKPKKLFAGAWLAGVAADSKGVIWLYCMIDKPDGKGGLVRRYRMDKPGKGELVWDKSDTVGRFTVSQDGALGAGVYDNPGTGKCGVFELPNKEFHFMVNGCQPAMLPGTNPYRVWVFQGDHRSGIIFTNPTDPKKTTPVRLQVGDVPSARGRYEVSFPKWSNHPRFMVLSSPFTPHQNEDGIPFPGGEKMDKYKRNYDIVEIAIGRLDKDLTRIEKWVQITDNKKGDYLPEAWIEGAADGGKTNSAAVAPKPGPAVAPADAAEWPIDRTGLVYLWETSLARGNDVTDAAGRKRICDPEARDAAIFGRNGAMDLAGGSFVAKPESTGLMLDACKKSGEFSLEVVIRPERLDLAKPGAIVSFATGTPGNVMLGMVTNKLVLRLRTSSRAVDALIPLVTFKGASLQHVIVTFGKGQVTCYLNGKSAGVAPIPGDLQGWTAAHLVFGDEYARGANWPGALEGIALYSRALEAPEAAAHCAAYAAKIAKRKPASRVEVSAKLYDLSPNSTPEAIRPYRRMLLVDNFEVLSVLKGTCGAKKISVAHWGILDDHVIDVGRAKGKTYTLVLELMAEHPQFESERTLNETKELDLPAYYEVDKHQGK